jgi:UDP-N-acetylmuramate dehydrogenase
MFKKNIDITELSNFYTKAKAKYFYEFTWNIDELKKVLIFAEENKLNKLIVWWWTNLLFAFDIFDWLVIKISLFWYDYDKNTKLLKIFSWEKISDIAEKLEKEYNNDLWHRFIGLPGTIGGAVSWNAWCFGLEAENNFSKAEVLNLDTLNIETLDKHQMNFSYRTSILKQTWKYVLLNVYFDLSKKIEKYHSDVDNIDFRENKQPSWYTCGSFFKNPSKENSAWKLIELVWLKWYKLWWAFFSQKHANFLMSDGTATYQNLLDLKDLAKQRVKDQFWIELEEEIRIIYSK